MPRFLNTWTGEFEWHPDPTKVVYAILSHVWRSEKEGGEQTFQQLQQLRIQQPQIELDKLHTGARQNGDQARVVLKIADSGEEIVDVLPLIFYHPDLSDKTKGICRVAREAGYRLVWNDACCIDRTNNQELSEAINSMYEWYKHSEMCYVFLADVPEHDKPKHPDSFFRRSKWHTRGWTLQELIAPKRVTFLNNKWRSIGSRMVLASTLASITEVGFDVLVGLAAVESVSVEQRMSWAELRMTTRVEDRAYSLMGIFGVHMQPLYGEGEEKAMYRLLEQVLKTELDQTSIFQTRRSCILRSLGDYVSSIHQFLYKPAGLLAGCLDHLICHRKITLLSPSHLALGLRLQECGSVPPLHSVTTAQGVRVQLLCLKLAKIPQPLEELGKALPWIHKCLWCMQLGEADALALLQCGDEDGPLIALPLCQPRTTAGQRPSQLPGAYAQPEHEDRRPNPIVRLTKKTLTEALKHVSPAPVEVSPFSSPLISKSLSWRFTATSGINLWPGDRFDNVDFHISPGSIQSLAALNFRAVPCSSALVVDRSERRVAFTITLEKCAADGMCHDEDIQQKIALCLTLTRLESADGWDWETDTLACLSVTNAIRGPSAECLPPHSPTNTRSYILQKVDCVNGSKESHTSEFDSRSILHLGTVTLAEFLIHADIASDEANVVRFLRVALEPPRDGSVDSESKNIWLSIEMSEEYRYIPPQVESISDVQVPSSLTNPPILVMPVRSKESRERPARDPGAPSRRLPTTTAPLPPSTTRYQGVREFPEDPTALHTGRDGDAALRAENDALRAENSALSARIADLLLHQAEEMSRMTAVLARLDSFTISQAAAGEQGPGPPNPLQVMTLDMESQNHTSRCCIVM